METNPNVPRQRNRRADRLAASEAQALPVQQLEPAMPVYPQQIMPVQQPVIPPQPMYSQPTQQPMVQAQPAVPAQPVRMQPQPRVMAQPRMVTPPQYPQQGYQQMPYPQQRVVYPQPVQQVQYAPRARVAAQPVVQQPVEVPHARAGRSLTKETAKAARIAQKEAEAKARQEALERAQWQKEKAEWEAEKTRRAKEKSAEEKAARPRKKVSGWLTTAISLSLIAVMGLVAAYYLMQAYLVQEEEARTAAWKSVLSNHHVTEQSDGSLRVTWQDEIEKYAAQYNLQPAFVTAIIRNESSFRTGAESNVGARGLMQMMPDTAEWIAGKLGDHDFNFDDMWDGETNIRYGCWYLGYLSRLFHGDAMLVSAAYHAGQTTVTQWLSDPNKSADGITLNLSKLADGPTKQYIGRVTQTYGIYQSLLYPDEAFGAQKPVSVGNSGFGITIER